ncbi:hypothetical protein EYF80_065509 [Liparis tanakae]|uniref:Uncharacterized protein n=1 Tax=Liparis tanakae TaxID=230148 RepID=A0A4Z2E6I5_9TELE|nr:hypothetical protein EYF80_065509 [Liparis tanakae]
MRVCLWAVVPINVCLARGSNRLRRHDAAAGRRPPEPEPEPEPLSQAAAPLPLRPAGKERKTGEEKRVERTR